MTSAGDLLRQAWRSLRPRLAAALHRIHAERARRQAVAAVACQERAMRHRRLADRWHMRRIAWARRARP